MNIEVIGGKSCSYCEQTKKYLTEQGLPFTYKNVHEDPEAMKELKSQGFRKIPQIWIDGKHIGGFTELHTFLKDT